jgi:hypothetical protein
MRALTQTKSHRLEFLVLLVACTTDCAGNPIACVNLTTSEDQQLPFTAVYTEPCISGS